MGSSSDILNLLPLENNVQTREEISGDPTLPSWWREWWKGRWMADWPARESLSKSSSGSSLMKKERANTWKLVPWQSSFIFFQLFWPKNDESQTKVPCLPQLTWLLGQTFFFPYRAQQRLETQTSAFSPLFFSYVNPCKFNSFLFQTFPPCWCPSLLSVSSIRSLIARRTYVSFTKDLYLPASSRYGFLGYFSYDHRFPITLSAWIKIFVGLGWVEGLSHRLRERSGDRDQKKLCGLCTHSNIFNTQRVEEKRKIYCSHSVHSSDFCYV